MVSIPVKELLLNSTLSIFVGIHSPLAPPALKDQCAVSNQLPVLFTQYNFRESIGIICQLEEFPPISVPLLSTHGPFPIALILLSFTYSIFMGTLLCKFAIPPNIGIIAISL